MKKLIFLVFLIFSGLTVFSQTGTGWAQQRSKVNFKDSVNIANGWRIGGTDVTPSVTEINYVTGVTSAIQTQIDANAADIDTLKKDTIDIADIAINLDDYAVMLADSIADSTGNYATQTQLATKLNVSDTVNSDGYLSRSDYYTDPVSAEGLKHLKSLTTIIKALPIRPHGSYNGGGSTMVDSRTVYTMFYVDVPDSATGLKVQIETQGEFTGDKYNGAALYSLSGTTLTLIDTSANDHTFFEQAAGTVVAMAFASGKKYLAKGYYMGAVLYNQSAQVTAPKLQVQSASLALYGGSGAFSNNKKLSGYVETKSSFDASLDISTLTYGNGFCMTIY